METSKDIELWANTIHESISQFVKSSPGIRDPLMTHIAIVSAMVGQLQEFIAKKERESISTTREFVTRLIMGQIELRPICPSNLDSEIERVVDLVTPPHGKN